eukprot:15320425-Ditylum_brightwellii.AAC.1
MVGAMNWLTISTCTDIVTIVNILAKYLTNPSKGHIEAAKRAAQYIKGTKNHGIAFHSDKNQQDIEAHIKFPIEQDITAMCNTNWGPQDASVPKRNIDITLELFKPRSISGLILWHHGPIHWVAKRQSITARSSAESEIYTTDECTKVVQNLHQT